LRPAARVLKKPTFAEPNPKSATRSASAFAVEIEPTVGRSKAFGGTRANVVFIIVDAENLSTGASRDRAAFEERSKRFGVAD